MSDPASVPEPGSDPRGEQIRRTLSYHRRTRHHLHRYAPGPEQLDWATQPGPFRTWSGAPRVDLPLLADALTASYADLYAPGAIRPRPADVNTVAVLFELALGLSAWKEYRGSRWALRCNPSSGNLHPTEGYAILPAVPGLPAGVYHYVSRDHALERRCTLDADSAAALAKLLPPGTFLVGLSSIHWREAWKYGSRAFRYCQHDAGHALAALRYAAAALGWSAVLLDHLGDACISRWLGLDRDADFAGLDALDREHPDSLLLVGPPPLAANLRPEAWSPVGTWAGTPNALSPRHVRWDAIDVVAQATEHPPDELTPVFAFADLPPLASATVPAARLIRQRRSCLALDGVTALDAGVLYRILDHLLPRPGVPPWDVLPWEPQLHPVLFVHRVHGLAPGLYALVRNPAHLDLLKSALDASFRWQRPAGCPPHLPLYLLAVGDYQARARTISCHQEIASDGAFALGMVARFAEGLRERGAWWYRRLFWESGLLGQVLYLEAEAAGVRGTGIGCYFDDAFHELLGLAGDAWQSLYHFTVGGPVDDPRLRTLAPYAHLRGR
jgi:SagB-type dehydrogenase family enzyme